MTMINVITGLRWEAENNSGSALFTVNSFTACLNRGPRGRPHCLDGLFGALRYAGEPRYGTGTHTGPATRGG